MEEAIIEPVKPVNAIDFEAVFELGKGSFGRVFLMRKQGT